MLTTVRLAELVPRTAPDANHSVALAELVPRTATDANHSAALAELVPRTATDANHSADFSGHSAAHSWWLVAGMVCSQWI